MQIWKFYLEAEGLEMSKGFAYFSYKMQCYYLENGSRSSVLALNVGLMPGIHNWCKFGDSTSKAKEVRDVIRFVTD